MITSPNPNTESASSQEVKATESFEELLARSKEDDGQNQTNSCSCCGRPTKHEGYCGRCLDF